MIYVDTLDDLDDRLASGARSLSGWRVRGLDLSEHGGALRAVDVTGALFLGCLLRPQDGESVRARGAIVFPTIPAVPIDMYRTTLYTPQEL